MPPRPEARRAAGRRHHLTAWAALALALVLVGVAVLVRDHRDASVATCPDTVRTDAPGGSWCPTYREDFDVPAPVGSFVNTTTDDWYLAASNPYAGSLRSYPDGWPTTSDLSLNLASRTAEVVGSVEGASGVFRLRGRTEVVDGRPQALGGSFYPVVRPGATPVVDQTSQLYGRYTVRFKTVGGYRPGPGGAYPTSPTEGRYGTAFLLWPANDRWAEGEVDFPEMGWGDRVHGFVHTVGDPEVNSAEFSAPTSSTVWSTATIEWSPGLLVFYADGVEVFRTTRDVPSVPMRWGFQSGGMLATPAPDVSGELLVDSVEIQSYAAGTGS